MGQTAQWVADWTATWTRTLIPSLTPWCARARSSFAKYVRTTQRTDSSPNVSPVLARMGLAGESVEKSKDRVLAEPHHAVRGVYVEHVDLLFGLINDRLAAVFEAIRYFEEQTGIANKAGANNLTEALSHIGTLVEYAHDMDSDQQREQVAYFGD